jgi:hypothetical protein
MTAKNRYEHILTKEFLEKEYVENKKSCRQLGKELKICPKTVVHYLNLHNINQEFRDGQILTGSKFNKLTAIEIVGKSKNRSHLWLCQCECGNKTIISTYTLKCKTTKSCGCSKKAIYKGFKDIYGGFWRGIKTGAKDRNLDFNITIEQAWELFEKQERKCYLSGSELQFGKNSKDYRSGYGTASLDRIDSSRGYESDNIGWVHKDINIIKFTFSVNEFIHYCKCITNFSGIFKKSNYDFDTHNCYLRSIKSSAIKRNLNYELINEQLLQKFNDQGGVCAFTGLDLVYPSFDPRYSKIEHTASLDRIDNSMGYTFENIQWVHKNINWSRMDYSIQKYKELCRMVYFNNSIL